MKIAVLGGGLAGISASYYSQKKKHDVVLIEKENVLGGLAGSIKYKGFTLDFGPHRFHTRDEETEKLFLNLMKDEVLERERVSRIYSEHGFLPYPPKIEALFLEKKSVIAKIIYDFLKQKIKNKIYEEKKISLEDWGINRFGKTLFRLYFGRYNEKIWGVPCSMMSYGWGEQRVDGLNVKNIIKKILRIGKEPKTFLSRFYYPQFGTGSFVSKFSSKIENIVLNFNVEEISRFNNGWKIKSGKKEIYADKIISTIPLEELIGALNIEIPDDVKEAVSSLKYRSTIFVFLLLNKEELPRDSWIYFHEQKMKICRISMQKNFSPFCVPEGKSAITCEIFSSPEEEIWKKNDSEIADICIREIDKTGIIEKKDVFDFKVIKYRNSYPLFVVGTENRIKIIQRFLSGIGIVSVGRQGSFYHTNMDDSIIMGREAVKKLIS